MECHYLWNCFTLIFSSCIHISLNSITMHRHVQARNRNNPLSPICTSNKVSPSQPLLLSTASFCLTTSHRTAVKPLNSPPTLHLFPFQPSTLPECFHNIDLRELLPHWKNLKWLYCQEKKSLQFLVCHPIASSFSESSPTLHSILPSLPEEGLGTPGTTCH